MSKVMVIGCGGVAQVAIQKIAKLDEIFTDMMIASRTVSKCDDLKKKIESCETPEARDKLRLAEYFSSRCEYTDSVAYTRGLSNILGNGNLNKVPHSGDIF